VAAPAIFTEKEKAFLRELNRQGVDYMIVGLSAAALQGAPAVTQDIDLWFRDLADPGLKKALDRVGGIYIPPTAATPPMLAGRSVALFDIVLAMHGLEAFEIEAAGALEMSLGRLKVKVLPLERIIVSKRAAGREKDRIILPVLEDAAAVLRSKRPRRRS
jgi:predicted nucleotidyltransferase